MAVATNIASERTNWVFIHFPLAVIDHKQIEQTVVVVIEPAGANRPHLFSVEQRPAHTRFGGGVSESAVSIVMKQLIAGNVCDKKIRPSIVIVIAHRYSHPVAHSGHPGPLRHIGERAIVVVVKEAVPILRGIFLERGEGGTADQVDVQVPVTVIVKQSYSSDQGFNLILIRSRTVGG